MIERLLAASLFLLAPIPNSRTPAAALARFPGLAHRAVLEIEQDFHPNDDYEIALDGWITAGGTLAEVRMWWMDTSKRGERSPFGKGVRRWISIDYQRRAPAAWTVAIRQGRKRFAFDVEVDGPGSVAAFGRVRTSAGVVEDCRVESSRLVARKVFGLPTGLRQLDVECVAPDGARYRGQLADSKP